MSTVRFIPIIGAPEPTYSLLSNEREQEEEEPMFLALKSKEAVRNVQIRRTEWDIQWWKMYRLRTSMLNGSLRKESTELGEAVQTVHWGWICLQSC